MGIQSFSVHHLTFLFSGHCFTDEDSNNPRWERITVAFGVDDITEIDDTFLSTFKIQKRKIKDVLFHSRYNYPRAYSDIVLVELRKRVTLSDNVYPICITDQKVLSSRSVAGATATMIGYGPHTKNSTTLNIFWSTIKTKGFCAHKYNPYNVNSDEFRRKISATLPKKFKDSGLICTTSLSDRGTCPGMNYFIFLNGITYHNKLRKPFKKLRRSSKRYLHS